MTGGRLSKAVLALVAAGAGSGAIATQFIAEHEGLSLEAYLDGARIWTICHGHTQGVNPGDVATPEQCRTWLATDVGHAFADFDRAVKIRGTIPETTRAAIVSWFFHVGGGKAAMQSTLIAKLNGGDRVGACHELPRWRFSGGKDCRDPRNLCLGVYTRRLDEEALCLL